MTGPLFIRKGREEDRFDLLAVWDRAIEWMVARGGAQQWGTEPASANERFSRLAREWVRAPGLRVAEKDGRLVGVSLIAAAAPSEHVPPTPLRETYLVFLLSDRKHAGEGIGSALIKTAASEARLAGSEVLRVDCRAGAPDLVQWYERQGFVRSNTYHADVRGGWDGQVFEMAL